MANYNSTILDTLIPKIKAVIFDMDGVLVDSESQHFRAHKMAIEENGGTLTKEFYSTHGISRDPLLFYADCFPDKKNNKEFLSCVSRRKLQIYRQLQEKEGILSVKPAISLVKFLYGKHIPLADGTAVYKNEAMKNLTTLGVSNFFRVIVTLDDVGGKRKPAPDIYLKVSQLLKVPPNRCLVIEDSENGVKAAAAAGMPVVVVPNAFTKTHNFTGVIIVSSFEQIKKTFSI